jgi:hypothetical protein
MFISARPQTNFSDTKAMKERFQSAATRAGKEQAVKDELQMMGEGLLALDGTEHDQDEAPGAVFVGNDKMIASVQGRPFGGILSMEIVKESGAEAQEYKIEPDLAGVSYTMKEGGVETFVYENGNGLLALMEQIETIAPDAAEEPKEEKPE